MPLALGIDGGGTRTRAVLLSDDGRLCGVGTGGPSNYDDVGADRARQSVADAFAQAAKSAGLEVARIDAAFFGMAGVVSELDRAIIRTIAAELHIAHPHSLAVDHDIRIALAGALTLNEGIAVVAGTGSSCYGRRQDGRSARAGGWGYLLDDLGSAYDLGLQAMIAIVRAEDGRSPATALVPPILQRLGISDVQSIMHRIYSKGLERAQIAALAPLVTAAADANDPVALKILKRGAGELALMARSVALGLGFDSEPVSIALTGGLIESSITYRHLVVAALAFELPHARAVEPSLPPVLGAGLLALKLLGSSIDDAMIGILQQDWKRLTIANP